MRTLRDLYAYNTWANTQVFAICRDVDQARLDEHAPGTYGTLTETLKHLVSVETAYAHMLHDHPLATAGARDEFFAHDLAWFAETMARVGRVYGGSAQVCQGPYRSGTSRHGAPVRSFHKMPLMTVR